MTVGVNRCDLKTMLAALPLARDRFDLTGERADVTIPASVPSEFVAPTLLPLGNEADLSAYQVIVVSAAGAVGKSTMAREIAARRNLALWNLAKAGSVGQGSLQGMITQAFGINQVAGVHAAMTSGSFGFVIDALDEGRIRINEAAFEDFLTDVGKLAGQLSGPGLILLGRTQIARIARWHLEDAGAKVALVEISHFAEEQRIEYVEKKIRRVNAAAADNARTHPAPFAEVRDKIFSLLSRAVGGDEAEAAQTEAFLGYAPVLDAVAVLLASDKNYATLSREIGALDARPDGSKRGPLSILRRVVETILEREQQEKLIPNIRQSIDAVAAKHGWSAWDELYSIEEQSARLLSVFLNTAPARNPTPSMPPELAVEYEERLKPWLLEHPFLRDGAEIGNAVFESFLIAQALVNDAGGMRNAIEAKLRDPRYKPNPLMGEFYLDLAPPTGIRVGHVGFIFDSLLSGLRDSSRMMFEFASGEFSDDVMESTADVDFEFVDADGDVVRQISFQVHIEVGSQLIFTRYLKDATIDTGIDVVLGCGATEYELGPRVDIECNTLNIEAASLVVTGSRSNLEPEDFGVVLVARTCRSKVTGQPIVRTQLQVTWPGAESYPWVKFGSARVEETDPKLADAFRRFRRIVLTLRSHKKGSLARVRDKVESQHVLGDGIGRRVLDRMVKDGILQLLGKFYHWATERADALVGVSWPQLHRSETSAKLRDYLKSIVSQ